MTNKTPKPVYQILLGFLMLAFTVVACNSKKEGDKKEPTPDTATVVKPADDAPPPPPPPVDDTAKKTEGPKDTAKPKPVKDPG